MKCLQFCLPPHCQKITPCFFFYQTIMLCPSPTGAPLLDHAINLYILASI